MRFSQGILLATCGLCCSLTSAEPWRAPLASGGQVEVDPRTNQPILIQEGRQTQLWNGVHRLEDGSVIQVREGRVVPRLDMRAPTAPGDAGDVPAVAPATSSAPSPAASLPGPGSSPGASLPGPGPLRGTAPCEELVSRVCGQVIECWEKPACTQARQLRSLDNDEMRAGFDPAQGTQTSKQCLEALSNGYFAPCPSLPR